GRMAPGSTFLRLIAEAREQHFELVAAAVDVADDVEGAGLALAVGPQRPALDDGGFDVLHGAQDEDVAEALLLQLAERAPEVVRLVADDVRPHRAVGAHAVALLADLLRQREDDGPAA